MIYKTVDAARLAACAIALSTILTACGGGGSSSDGTTPTASTTDTTDPALIEAERRKDAPTIAGTPASTVVAGQQYSFEPTTNTATAGSLAFSIANKPTWAVFETATGKLSGTPGTADVGTFANIVITATGKANQKASLTPFTITVTPAAAVVRSATLSWQAPTQNVDGSPVKDLKGYKIRYGTASGAYTQVVAVDNPSTTRYVLDGLTPGTYYFTVSAYNVSGLESDPAGEVSKTLN